MYQKSMPIEERIEKRRQQLLAAGRKYREKNREELNRKRRERYAAKKAETARKEEG